MIAAGRELVEPWPGHPDLPAARVGRCAVDELDQLLRDRCPRRRGATCCWATRRSQPIVERGFVRGATARRRRRRPRDPCPLRRRRRRCQQSLRSCARHVPRARVAVRHRDPHATGHARARRPVDRVARSTSPDRNGNPIAGYGWIFPVGDGTVNVGVGLLSTYRDFASVNTTHLLDAFADQVAERWEIDPADPLQVADQRFRVPMGGSVGPKMGPTFLVVGDASGAVNPFNGEGVDYALTTGRASRPRCWTRRSSTGDSTAAAALPEDARRRRRRVRQGRSAVGAVPRTPGGAAPLLRVGMHSER